MDIKEVFHILETEKFSMDFNNSSLYNKVMLIKLRKSFSEYFFIPENSLYKTKPNTLFFISLICSKKYIDIEKIKMDIYNKIPLLTLSIKYLEPSDVIQEIKENIDTNIIILKNKIYTVSDLTSIFNLSCTTITKNKILSKFSIKNKHGSNIFWLGSAINKNLDEISKNTISGLNINNNLVPLIKLYNHIDIDPSRLREKIKMGSNIFG